MYRFMEKLIINPSEVRGLGDIVSPKTASDFDKYNSTLSESTDTNLGKVFTESYLAGSSLSMSVDSIIDTTASSFTVELTLRNSSEAIISGATVSLDVNGVSTSQTTNASGKASFTVSTDGSSVYQLKGVYEGSSIRAGCFVKGKVYVVDPTGLSLICDKSIMQSDDKLSLLGQLTGTNIDGETVGVPNQTVSFYEEWTPGLRCSANPSIIQVGDDADLSAQLIDNTDGSLVREAGHTVTLYQQATNGVLFSKNTEQTFTSESTVVYESMSGHITGLENTDWTLEFDFKGDGGLNIGATTKFSPPSSANYRFFVGVDDGKFAINNRRSTSSFIRTQASASSSTYYHMILNRSGDTFSAYYDGNLIGRFEGNVWFDDYSSFELYFINWSGTSYVKNVKLVIGE